MLVDKCLVKSYEPTDDEIKTYDKWIKVDEMARCYILSSMANVLQYEHQSMTTAYDMPESLKEMFGEQNCAAKQTVMKALLTTKMVKGTSVREYVLKIMSLLNELEILSAVIDKESQIKMVLQTLPDSFQQFCLNYNMNKMDLSLTKLLNELQTTESIIKQQAPPAAFMADRPSASTSKPKGDKKKKKKPRKVSGAYDGVDMPKGKYSHCKQPGHYKK
ncbi:uncharacterized protein LOC124889767 [Capsicum annuum]|uniref:uncharacterized protein LOC124889767 n=1 Tax=Capsicum annuum TaxID=4072 RepID=UPI001FB179E7|nr:uncharacterized protein LOC124889767 [Capsicum annuum]